MSALHLVVLVLGVWSALSVPVALVIGRALASLGAMEPCATSTEAR
ncbi:MAG: hypothetical protein JO086_02140 [Acidimicrobiia bacterium]|nr:hypothetical protein [Acidimicrobiia bacterium]